MRAGTSSPENILVCRRSVVSKIYLGLRLVPVDGSCGEGLVTMLPNPQLSGMQVVFDAMALASKSSDGYIFSYV